MSSKALVENPEPGCLDLGLSQTRLLKKKRNRIKQDTDSQKHPFSQYSQSPAPFSFNALRERTHLNACQIGSRVLNAGFFLIVLF